MEQLYWKLLQQVLAQGWREVAQDLIAEHWVQGAAQRESADSELTAADHRTHSLLHVLSVVLAKAPSYLDARPGPWTSFQEFLDYRATWVQTVVDLLDGDDFEGEVRVALQYSGLASPKNRLVIPTNNCTCVRAWMVVMLIV